MIEIIEKMLDPENLKALARVCIADEDRITATQIRSRMENAGLLAALELKYDPPPEIRTAFPQDWTAYQVGVFDNGDQRDKRGRPRATKTRYGIGLKLWVGDKPDFKKQPDWQMTFPQWSRKFAIEHIAKLKRRGTISPDFSNACEHALGKLSDNHLFGIPMIREAGAGSGYRNGHIFSLRLKKDVPSSAVVFHDCEGFQIDHFVNLDPAGRNLTGKAVAAARITKGISLPQWETQTIAN